MNFSIISVVMQSLCPILPSKRQWIRFHFPWLDCIFPTQSTLTGTKYITLRIPTFRRKFPVRSRLWWVILSLEPQKTYSSHTNLPHQALRWSYLPAVFLESPRDHFEPRIAAVVVRFKKAFSVYSRSQLGSYEKIITGTGSSGVKYCDEVAYHQYL